MSFFSSKSDKTKGSFSSVAERVAVQSQGSHFFGPLEPQDLYWTCAGGFVTETQTFYTTTCTGDVIMFQVIHSAVGLWSPNVQLTFAHFQNEGGKAKRTWKSINVSHFQSPPSNSKLDKRSSKGDQFSITVKPEDPDTYLLEGKYDNDISVSLTVKRAPKVPGWKVGSGPRGGFSYFGSMKAEAAKNPAYTPDNGAGSDGYVVHRFWPRTSVSGVVRVGTTMIDMAGSKGVMVHAIQGMRPNLVACRWNFADLQTVAPANNSAKDDGVSLVMMEFTTTSAHHRQVVNIGSVVVDDELVAVTLGGTKVPASAPQSSAEHKDVVLDKETGYNAPMQIDFQWKGPYIKDPSKNVEASLLLHLAQEGGSDTKTYQTRGLGEKVDVLAEIPFIIKKVVNVVSGAKPYIYQWHNPVEATILLPDAGGTGNRTVKVTGYLYNEASYVSETP